MTNLTLKLTNNASATFGANVPAAATTFSLAAGQGARFPALSGDDYFPLTAVKPTGEREIMYAVGRSFDVITVLRHQENTVALDFLAGEIIECRLTAGALFSAMGQLTNLVNTAVTAFQPGVGVTTDTVLTALDGDLTVDQFAATLAARIDQIDAVAAVPGSVNARVKAETDSRVAAVQAEIDARIAAVAGEATARTSYVQNYTYAKSTIDDSIAFQASTTQAAYIAYADARKTEAISAAAADVRTYAYSKTTSDGALATQMSTITASYTTYADTKKSEAIGAAATDATNKANNAISVASADVRNYSYSQAQTNSAIAASESTLRAEFTSGQGGYATQAYVQSYSYSVAQADAAIASQTSDLRTTVGNHTTAIQTNSTSINGVTGQVFTKIDSNGYVTGFGLSSTTSTATPTSSFIVLAANFQIAAPGSGIGPHTMFSVGTIDGAAGLGVADVSILDGAIKARAIDVVNLQAVSALIGTLRTASSGARVEIADNIFSVYNASNVRKVKIGNLAL